MREGMCGMRKWGQTFFILTLCYLLGTPILGAARSRVGRQVASENEGGGERYASLAELRVARRVGIGVSAAGPLAILGVDIDVNLAENFSLGIGLGTGFDYTSMMLKSRLFLLGERASPYLGLGLARWWGQNAQGISVGPSLLTHDFVAGKTGPFSIFMIYPTFGVQLMTPTGFEFYGELEYLVTLFNFAGGLYGALGFHWYF